MIHSINNYQDTYMFNVFNQKLETLKNMPEHLIEEMTQAEYLNYKKDIGENGFYVPALKEIEDAFTEASVNSYGYSKSKGAQFIKVVIIENYSVGGFHVLPYYFLKKSGGFFEQKRDPTKEGSFKEYDIFSEHFKRLDFNSLNFALPDGRVMERIVIKDGSRKDNDNYTILAEFFDAAQNFRDQILNYQKLDSELAPKTTNARKPKI